MIKQQNLQFPHISFPASSCLSSAFLIFPYANHPIASLAKFLQMFNQIHSLLNKVFNTRFIATVTCPSFINIFFSFFLSFLMPPHVHTNFRGPPSWLWRKCNQLLRLERPWGAVTLSRWCEGSSGQSFWLLITKSRVRFPALPWEFSL